MADDDPVTAPLLFLLGLVVFVAGTLAFVADLVTGHDVVRSLLANALGAFLLVGWAARDTLADPESAVDSPGGAAGTALLLYGIYLVIAGGVVAVTSVWHGRLSVALAVGAVAAVLIVVGFLIFPRESVVGDDESEATVRERDAGGDPDGGSRDGGAGEGETGG